MIITATALVGSKFSGWSNACTGTGSCTVSMDAGLVVKPGTATLFFTRYPINILSQRVGSMTTDFPLKGLGIPTSVGGAVFVPSNLPNAEDLLVSTFGSGQVLYTAAD